MKIFFSAGEPSGDQHAAHLIAALRRRDPELQAVGFGGPEMRCQQCELQFELTQLAVMGFLRVLPMIAKFRRLVIQAEKYFAEQSPDAVVLVDFPGFNWWIARAARRRNIPVYYYLPPQLWAWAPWRIRKVRRFVDHVICALKFEYEWYAQRGVSATWVGHPFFDEVAEKRLDNNWLKNISDDRPGPVIGILPGSRNGEVRRNFPTMLRVVKQVAERHPNVRWLVAAYRDEHVQMCREMQKADETLPLEYHVGRTSEIIEAADCCFMVSGSISLELLARTTPGVVLYRVARYEKLAARLLMNCPYITLTNLVAAADVMPEFISAGSGDSDVAKISHWLERAVTEQQFLHEKREQFRALAETNAITGASDRAAELLLEKISGHYALRAA